MEMKLRKHQNTLVVAATGVVLFGLWSIVKTLMFLTSSWAVLATEAVELGLTNKFVIAFIIAIMIAVLGADLLMRLYIGFCAISEGKGTKSRSFYLLVAGWMFFASVISFPANLHNAYITTGFALDTLIATVLEFTSLYALADLLFSGIRIKQLRKQLEKQ